MSDPNLRLLGWQPGAHAWPQRQVWQMYNAAGKLVAYIAHMDMGDTQHYLIHIWNPNSGDKIVAATQAKSLGGAQRYVSQKLKKYGCIIDERLVGMK